jgi:8-oxo-dGTP diphosphatase
MPHIHTKAGQHDMTVSAYVIRTDDDKPKLLVHMHKKIGKLMQIGGHIELDETPWQALSHELLEEGGYNLSELKVLQPQQEPFVINDAIVHPVPLLVNTHKVSDTHYHSDLVYGLITDHLPLLPPQQDESNDLRWLTVGELEQAADQGIALKDVSDIFTAIARTYLGTYYAVETSLFSVEKP